MYNGNRKDETKKKTNGQYTSNSDSQCLEESVLNCVDSSVLLVAAVRRAVNVYLSLLLL